jgi:hypothetical protein
VKFLHSEARQFYTTRSRFSESNTIAIFSLSVVHQVQRYGRLYDGAIEGDGGRKSKVEEDVR